MKNIRKNWARSRMFYSMIGAFSLFLILTFVINLVFYYQEAADSEQENREIIQTVVQTEVSSITDFLSNIQTDTDVLYAAPGLLNFSNVQESQEALLSYLQTYVQSRYAFDAAAYYHEGNQVFCGFSDRQVTCTNSADAQEMLNLSDTAFQTLANEGGFALSHGTDIKQMVTCHRISEDVVCFRVLSYDTIFSLLHLVSSKDTVFEDYATSLIIEDKIGQQLCIGEPVSGIPVNTTSFPAAETGIQFHLLIPDRTNEIVRDYVGNVIFYYGSALLICGIMLICILSARIYQPVKSVLDILPENIPLDQESSEHNRIQEAILQLISNQEAAEELLNSQNSVLCQNFLHRLVLGGIPDQNKVEKLLDQYALSSCFDQYAIICLIAVAHGPEKVITFEDVEIPSQISGTQLYRISSKQDHLILLASGFDEQNGFVDSAEELIEYMENVLETSVCLVQSGIHHTVSEANAAYLEASVAAEKVIESNQEPGIYHYRELQNTASEYAASTSLNEMEQQLIKAISMNQADIAERIFSQFRTQLEQSAYSVRLQRIQIAALLSRLLMLPAVAERIHHTTKEAELLALLTPNLSNADFEMNLKSLSTQILSPIHNKQSPATDRFDHILAYVHQHIFEETLCAAEVADHFGISPSSLSRAFQKHTGAGFSNYIHTKRIAMARIMLEQSGKAVKEIALEVGYANSLSFTRAFRKYEGITPGAYRTSKGSE